MKILVLFAHPAYHKSRVNRLMVEGLKQMQDVTFHDLYDVYPESYINVKHEQKLVEEHDVIVFQFPLFWYSTPSILKEWQDLVLEHGWAFGSEGNALKDTLFLCSITAGGPEAAYQVGGFHNHTINQLIAPLRQTAVLCKMIPLPPFVVFGGHAIEPQEVQDQALDLMNFLKQLGSGKCNMDKVAKVEYLNEYLVKS